MDKWNTDGVGQATANDEAGAAEELRGELPVSSGEAEDTQDEVDRVDRVSRVWTSYMVILLIEVEDL